VRRQAAAAALRGEFVGSVQKLRSSTLFKLPGFAEPPGAQALTQLDVLVADPSDQRHAGRLPLPGRHRQVRGRAMRLLEQLRTEIAAAT